MKQTIEDAELWWRCLNWKEQNSVFGLHFYDGTGRAQKMWDKSSKQHKINLSMIVPLCFYFDY